MEKPDFDEIIHTLQDYSQNLNENHQIGNSKLILAFAESIRVMGWASCQSDTNNTQVANLTEEIKELKSNLATYSKSSNLESKAMRYLTYALGMVAIFQLTIAYWQYRLGEVQIDVSMEQMGLEKAIWEYEMMREDRIEMRDVQWRREDLEFQGRLPVYEAVTTDN